MKPTTVLIPCLALLAAPAFADKPREAVDTAAAPADKVICRRYLETGSLVKGYRVCQTKREWDRQREEKQDRSTAYSCQPNDATGAGC